ncbi:hypothetical protein [Gimesia sp.]|uniref:hypothetical protein n=1 Tax=Gimesia sp. TaxID=2024833 RepID=UPI003A92A9E9
MKSAKFSLGQVVATAGALEAIENASQTPTEFLVQHAAGHWGELCVEDQEANNEALKTGARLLSVYHLADDTKIWIITEAADENGQREATTILLPSEY